ncbi:MAG: AAA family ATPase [Myxococcota bacterium]
MADAPLIQVESIVVQKLFGLYDHAIQLKLGDRVTIVHGPNGVGKTAILRLVTALFGWRLAEFARVPFDKFEVTLTDKTRITVEPGEPGKRRRPSHTPQIPLKVAVHSAHGSKADTFQYDERRYAETLMVLERELPWLNRISEEAWMDGRTGTTLSTAEVLARYSELVPVRAGKAYPEPEWFQTVRAQVRVHFIEAQRLLRIGPSEPHRGRVQAMVPTVRDYAQDLQRRVGETLARYASESQSLDQSFPQRLLVASAPALNINEIKDRMAALDVQRTKLRSISLLDDSGGYPFDITSLDKLNSTQTGVMSLYVQDTERKLGTLDDLARRIELLRDNVNQKFAHKSIRIDRERGFHATGHDDTPLELEALSSGEQHELVLLYDLLFRVQPNTLVLIDEPELSLHVGWQKRFLPELLQIVKAAQFDALVATHSPFIVGDRSDLMVPLGTDALRVKMDETVRSHEFTEQGA